MNAQLPAGGRCTDRTPRIALCAAFSPGFEVASFVASYPYPIEFVATCVNDASGYESRIALVSEEKGIPLLRKINANSDEFIEELKQRKIDIVLLAWWPAIITQKALNAVTVGWLNMHPSLLPYGRGKHGYYWSIVEGTPFGVTLHFIDHGIDTGDIVFQRELTVGIEDTGEQLYHKGVREVISLFKEVYRKIITLDFERRKQDDAVATAHHSSEIEAHSGIVLNKEYRAGDLINIIRGRTFMDGPSAFFFVNGKKYLIRSMIEEA